MSREIVTTHGTIIVDDEDFALVSRYRWTVSRRTHGVGYAYAHSHRENGKAVRVAMHRLLLGARAGEWVDHVNGNGLDNRRCNIRICTPSQNAMNRRPLRGSIPLRGVAETNGRYLASISADNNQYILGTFDAPEEAARVYDTACRLVHGEFGHLNYPDLPSVPLGPVVMTRAATAPHPALAPLVVPSAQEVARERRAAASRERRARRAAVATANEAVMPLLSPRHAEIVRAFLTANGNASHAALALGISRERVRQVVARAEGKGLQRPVGAPGPRPQYDMDAKAAAVRLSDEIGLIPACDKLGLSITTLSAWRAANGCEPLKRGPKRPRGEWRGACCARKSANDAHEQSRAA